MVDSGKESFIGYPAASEEPPQLQTSVVVQTKVDKMAVQSYMHLAQNSSQVVRKGPVFPAAGLSTMEKVF